MSILTADALLVKLKVTRGFTRAALNFALRTSGGYYNMTAYSTSSDLIHWTFPEIITPKDRRLNHSSPGNIIRFDGKWIICLQTYPTPNLETFGTNDSRIWIMRSDDLVNWAWPGKN